jgi:hypothetical protein
MASAGNEVASQLDVLQGDTAIFSTADPTKQIKVKRGSLSFDETRMINGECSAELILDAETAAQVPVTPTSVYAPTSPTEFQPFLGFIIPSTGQPDVVSMGLFDLADTEIDEQDGGLTMFLQGYDRSRKLDRARFISPYTVAQGTNYLTAIQSIVQLVFPTITFLATATAYATPLLTFDVQTTYLEACKAMADSIGYTFRFDYLGRCVIQPTAAPTGDPQWSLQVGSSTRILGGNRKLSDEKVYNGVIVRGEPVGSDTPPVQGEAWDTDPSSPTFYDPANPGASSYGPVPFFFVSEFITTSGQAIDAAAARLPRVKGLVERLVLETRLNPGMEIGDLVDVERARIGATGLYIVESIVCPLGAGRMTVTMRERRL